MNNNIPFCRLFQAIAIVFSTLFTLISTEIQAGERMHWQASWWVLDGTADQLVGFDVLRLPSNFDTTSMNTVKTLGKNLAITLTPDLALAETYQNGVLIGIELPDVSLQKYNEYMADSLNVAHDGGHLIRFRNKLNVWAQANIDIKYLTVNHEVSRQNLINVHPSYASLDSLQISLLYTDFLKKYKEILSNHPDYYNTKFIVFSGAHEEGIHNYRERQEFSVDWNSLTQPPNAIDICFTKHWIMQNLVGVPDPEDGVGAEKKQMSDLIRWTSNIANSKPVIVDISLGNGLSLTHLNWEHYRELARHSKSVCDSVNNMDSPIIYSNYHYRDCGNRPYTPSFATCLPPPNIFPHSNGFRYPASFWENNEVGNWGYNQVPETSNMHNKWEREIISNFLTATGASLPGHTLTASQTWRGDVYLIGDVVIPAGKTLTIESGTNVYLRKKTDVYESGTENGLAEIVVAGGNLSVNGTQSDPVVFGIDADMEGAEGVKGDWGGIRQESGSMTLNNSVINHAENGIEVTGGSSVALTNVTIGHGDTGIKIAGLNNGEQVWIENTTIHDHKDGHGITVVGSPQLSLVNSTLRNNKFAVTLDSGGQMVAEILNCDISNVDGSIGGDTAINAVNNPELNVSYSNIFGFSFNYAGSINGWPHPANGVGAGGENRGNFDLDPKYFNSVDELNTDSPLIDAGKPDLTMSDPNDGTRINIGRYGGTTLAKAAAAGGGQKLFFDEFGGTGNWQNETGNWGIVSGRYERTGGGDAFNTINTAGATSWTDYSMEFQINGARDGGVFVRAQDKDNAVAFFMRPNHNDAYWQMRQGGNWGSQYGSVALNNVQGATLFVKVTAVGDTYTAYINGVVATSFTNTTFSSGKIGLYSSSGVSGQSFDNIAVTSLGGGSSGGGAPTVLLDEPFDYVHGTEPAPGWIDVGDANQVHWKVKNNEYVLESSNIGVTPLWWTDLNFLRKRSAPSVFHNRWVIYTQEQSAFVVDYTTLQYTRRWPV